ncbi:hypothetical protein V8G54_026716 [Vigna mungo]|uniref:Uncharacterized protein n=1 Tax=Vigna mungo TaxID=3915 RepID=A0AAQ3RNF6_VIGMU
MSFPIPLTTSSKQHFLFSNTLFRSLSNTSSLLSPISSFHHNSISLTSVTFKATLSPSPLQSPPQTSLSSHLILLKTFETGTLLFPPCLPHVFSRMAYVSCLSWPFKSRFFQTLASACALLSTTLLGMANHFIISSSFGLLFARQEGS